MEAANRLAPEFGRLFHETIVVSNKNKPLPRTPKGTVSRKAALEVYKAEISSMFVQPLTPFSSCLTYMIVGTRP